MLARLLFVCILSISLTSISHADSVRRSQIPTDWHELLVPGAVKLKQTLELLNQLQRLNMRLFEAQKKLYGTGLPEAERAELRKEANEATEQLRIIHRKLQELKNR